MSTQNPNVKMTLAEAVDEVQSLMYGLYDTHIPEHDTFYTTTRFLNQALKANAREVEWSYYSGVELVGSTAAGVQEYVLPNNVRPRILGDDSVRLVDYNGKTRVWAYMLPRDAIHKYRSREGLWATVTRNSLYFSKPIPSILEGLSIQVPVMREPRLFRLPPRPKTAQDPVVKVPQETLDQPVDFESPDLIVMKAVFLHAQTDPLMQTRVATLDDQYKNYMYGLKERDEQFNDAPYINDFAVPVQANIHGGPRPLHHAPHADERDWWSA